MRSAIVVFTLLASALAMQVAAQTSAAEPVGHSSGALSRDEQVTLVVHTAENCPVCRVWRESPSGLAVAQQLPQRWPHLNVVYVERKSLHGSESELLYPAELQYLYQARRERYQLSPPVPLFEIVRNRQVVARQAGLQGWTDGIVPALQQLEAGRPASAQSSVPR
ncbi:hypothetical protein [Piscinibacter sp.]|jgi:hypothetical protein|uniref:hypothetical protein n=1 Tax=Piscinibacter sp. TaxID=1903157 RepID=UPI001B4FA7BB|nr:hypothetical protein [Piscinibacter sp.]MBK7530846.1 hypothetical protein [Piscinibacter sp.]MBP6541224.1 hypothetical protein [Piscinibacter sp.]